MLRRSLAPAAVALLWFGVVLGAAVLLGVALRAAEAPRGSTAFDRSVLHWLVAHRTGALTAAAHTLSTIGSQKVLLPAVALVALALLVVRRRVRAAVVLVVAWFGALELYTLAKIVVGRPRPPHALWLAPAGGKAFPSGHAVQSLATFVALAFALSVLVPRLPRRAGVAVAVVLAAGVGWSRAYLAVHWATDVLGGWVIAAAWIAGVTRRS